jgi:hypothetical protein
MNTMMLKRGRSAHPRLPGPHLYSPSRLSPPARLTPHAPCGEAPGKLRRDRRLWVLYVLWVRSAAGAAGGVSVKLKPGLRRSVPAGARAGARVTECQGTLETCQVFLHVFVTNCNCFQVGECRFLVQVWDNPSISYSLEGVNQAGCWAVPCTKITCG